jgi:Domain of unknown function (DUF4062)
MEKRFQIFVSSTYADLRDERERLLKDLTKNGFIAAGMEQFPSTDEDKFEYIQRVIDESDYYIVIIKGKYGSLDEGGVSFTEKEYIYAKERKLPALAFVYAERTELRVAETDNDPEKQKKLNAFIFSLEEKKIVSRWATIDELLHLVKDSLRDLERRKPGVGWIRGDRALDPKIINDLEQLRRENLELKSRLDSTQGKVSLPADLLGGKDNFALSGTVEVFDKKENKFKLLKKFTSQVTYDDVLEMIAD